MESKETIPCVELRNVVKRFADVTAVDHVSCRVDEGKVFSLLGPSGCGKTTALRLVAGLETVDEGDILIGGKIVNNIPPYNRDCSIVFQTLALFPHMTVERNIAYGLKRRRVPENEIRRRVGEMLELVALSGMEKRRPDQLSGGQRQRVALARSLVLSPRILLLDEPLASLDRKLRKEMQTELREIQREVGITFLYVTHDQKEALAISDVIAVMREGKLEQIGSPKEIYELPRTRFVADFMGATNIFCGRVAASGGKVQLKTAGGLSITIPEIRHVRPEEITGVSIHPEQIEILAKADDLKGDNAFMGRILEMVYQGDFVELKISLDQTDEIITAHLSSTLQGEVSLAPSQKAIVRWSPASGNVLLG